MNEPNEKFTKEYVVDYNDINEDLTTSLTRLMSYVQETSLFHSLNSGYTMEYFAENNVGFLLTNWHVNILKYPKWGEKIRIQTWPSKFRGIFAERGFEVFDEKGESILQAASRWVFTDLKKHKPIKITADMYKNYGQDFPEVIDSSFKLPEINDYEKISESVFETRRSDIDSNHHVNNIRYIGWAMDFTDPALYQFKNVTELKVAYKKECVIHTQILLEIFKNKQDENSLFYMIKSYENPETIFCIIHTKWACS